MALVEAWVKLKYTKSEMNHFRGVKTHAVWVFMLHPDPGHHLQEHGATPMATMHLLKIKLPLIFQTTLNLISSDKLTLLRKISQFRKHFSIRPESKPHNFLSGFTRGATVPANSALFILH